MAETAHVQPRDLPPAILLMGPTASGKTDLAVRLLEEFPCEIISVDSAMVYRGMDIGTAKPEPEILQKAPHRLVDILEPAEAYSAARFRDDALREIREILGNGRIPLLVGGTMLYFRALLLGLSELPAADNALRKRLEEEARSLGWNALHERLAKIDPASASRIHPNDPQRIQRALEVYELTGETLSEHYQQQSQEPFPCRPVSLVLAPQDRSLLHNRIEQRFHQMLDEGLVREVERLWARGDLSVDLPSMRSVGYRQILKYLLGDYTYEQAVAKGIVATRQLAKRQMTWLRSWKDAHWFETTDARLMDKVLKFLRENGVQGIA